MEALLRWAAELGVSDSPSAPTTSTTTSSCLGRSLVVADFPAAGGRGFAAARDLRRGELVLRVPRAALLTSDRVMADDPRIASCVDAHRPRLSSIQVSSRTLHVAWDDAGCLCPIGDLFNYAAPDDDTSSEEQDTEEAMKYQERNVMLEEIKLDSSSERMTDGGYEDSNAYCLYARKRYRKGEQVLLGYGTYTNLELLEHYGFLLDENPNEKTYIQLDSELCTMGTWPKDSLYIHPNGHPSFALLCALRLGSTPTNRRKSFSHQIYSGSMLSVENELEVLKRLGSKCVETLQQLPTTAELDGRLIHFLRRLQNSTNWRADVEQSSFGQEFVVFLRFHSLDLDCTQDQLPVRLLRSLERWELAVRWRCSYKIALTKCVLYCKCLINELSLQ
ncbi:protein SET DOMAIN GROUP 40-like isoform X2 [Triticum dicoccoides]|uniref:protein SET DOMAIN GROUP 40-like isoform X2 n=1 Tax=Triticum dicoccoides TaxID=85692 RepID=UPI00188F7B5A|nr:protein SET DOMAIN GROUP 40-like isoform X2 [Triticum dicoccoides]